MTLYFITEKGYELIDMVVDDILPEDLSEREEHFLSVMANALLFVKEFYPDGTFDYNPLNKECAVMTCVLKAMLEKQGHIAKSINLDKDIKEAFERVDHKEPGL